MKHSQYMIMASVLCITSLVFGQADTKSQVTRRDGSVMQDDKVADAFFDTKTPESSLLYKYGDQTWLKITSLILTPPKGMEFRQFPKNWNCIFRYADVHMYDDANTIGGVVIGLNGAPMEGPGQIKVFMMTPAPTNAANFPLRAEGNLQRAGTATAQTKPITPPQDNFFWRIKSSYTNTQKHLLLKADPTIYFWNGSPSVPPRISTGTVLALNEEDKAQEGVTIQIKMQSYQGDKALGSIVSIMSGTTKKPSIDPIGDIDPSQASPPILSLDNMVLRDLQTEADAAVLTATATGYQPTSVRISLPKAMWRERKGMEYHGFDACQPEPWLVVGVGETSTASTFVRNASIARQIALRTSPSADINPKISENEETNTDITGKAARANAQALARKDHTDIASMNICVKTTKRVTLKFVFAKDSAGNGTPVMDENARNEFSKEAVRVWKDQAVVDLQLDPNPTLWNINKEMGTLPTRDQWVKAIYDRSQGAPQAGPNEILILVVWGIGGGRPFANGRVVFVRPDDGGLPVDHEIGHALGIVNHSGEEDNLMGGYGASIGSRIRKYQADIVNSGQ